MIDINRISNKVVCVGKNYAAHAAEMQSAVPEEPLIFLKPWTTIRELEGDVKIPTDKGEVHYELEIAFVIGSALSNASEDQVVNGISGVGLALDLTLRDKQSELSQQGYPWDKSKGFDGSCPIQCLPMLGSAIDFDTIELQLLVNGETQQQAISTEMVFQSVPLISHMSKWFTLNPGDIILTGTPAGVNKLNAGDQLSSRLSIAGKDLLHVDSVVTV